MKYFKKRFGIFLDELRKSRNISKEEFIQGICSERQYLRYISGQYYLSNEKIIPFASRLKIDVLDLFQMYDKSCNNERKQVNELLSLLNQFRNKEVLEKIKDINTDSFISDINLELIEVIKISAEYRLKIISKTEAKNKLKTLIDYDNCILKSTLNMVEINAISQIALIESSDKEIQSTIDLYNKVMYLDKMGVTDSNFVAPLYANTAQLLSIIGEYEKSLEVALEGIKFCFKDQSFKSFSLTNLYYYAAFNELRLGNKDSAINYAKKTFHALAISENKSRYEFFKNHFERVFKMKLSDIFVE